MNVTPTEQPAAEPADSPHASPKTGIGPSGPPSEGRPGGHGRSNPFVPLLLASVGLLGWFVLQSWLLMDERATLRAAHAAQQQTVDNAAKLRQSLDALAADTQRLADGGNPNARLLVEELRRRGITINPNAPAPGGAGQGAKSR